jgi:hypothetical protein
MGVATPSVIFFLLKKKQMFLFYLFLFLLYFIFVFIVIDTCRLPIRCDVTN